MNWPSRVASITLAAALLWVANARSAHAANAGVGEMGVALVQPIADGGYRGDFQTSPALWLAGVYLPEFGEREFGVELGFEWTSYWDDYRDVLGR